MNTDLRARLLATFQTGTAKELAVVLAIVHLLSIHSKNHEAGPDFPLQAGSSSKHETNQLYP
jgi:hypothetical protein